MGLRAGASERNFSRSPRPSAFIDARSCDGLATPRVAANASASSSGVKYVSAISYTCSGSDRRASTSIMLPRSTACRHGAADRAGWGLVLEAAVQHAAPQVVAAVRADVVLRVERREDRSLDTLIVADPHLQRR